MSIQTIANGKKLWIGCGLYERDNVSWDLDISVINTKVFESSSARQGKVST